jgi:large subunit ribosomal protein L20
MAKGYRGGKSRLFRTATEAVDRALCYAYRDRRTKKRNFRRLWITRITAASNLNGTNYSKLIHGMKQAGIEIDRKVLSNLAIVDPNAFTEVVKAAGIQAS